MQQYFNTRLRIDNIDGIVLREILIRTLHNKEHFSPVKKTRRNFHLRWDRLEGVVFIFKHQRFRLNSAQKGRNVLENFKGGNTNGSDNVR